MITSAIEALTGEIAALCSPEEIWLYSRKLDLEGRTTSFKLCVVVESRDKAAVETDIYLKLDCSVPYDLTVYTAEEWDAAGRDPHSFARFILTKGQKLYGKKTLE